MNELEDKRKKLMKQIGMTDDQLVQMRPAQTSTAKSMFDATGNQEAEKLQKTLAS